MNSEKYLRKEICEIGTRLYMNGFVPANDGNISTRINENELLITPAGISKGFLKPNMLCKINMSGEIIKSNGFTPSSEIKVHLLIYKENTKVNAIIHAHPPFATAFAVAKIPLANPILPEMIYNIGVVPIVEYGMPSTDELSMVVAKYIQKYDALLLENHGTLSFSQDLLDSFFKTERIEYFAKILFLASTLVNDKRDINISKKEVEKILNLKKP